MQKHDYAKFEDMKSMLQCCPKKKSSLYNAATKSEASLKVYIDTLSHLPE